MTGGNLLVNMALFSEYGNRDDDITSTALEDNLSLEFIGAWV